jgi:hypothetical protein
LRADFFDSFGPFDGIKRDCWEGGERVPTIAWCPGHIPAGRVITQPSISYDWLRTFAEAADVPAPARADGVSLWPELTGRGVPRDRDYIYVEYYHQGRTPNYTDFSPNHRGRKRGQMQTIRIGNYVGVRYNIRSQADPFEIYDVTADPGETNNLASGRKSLEEQMKNLTLQIRRPDSEAPRPYDNEMVPAISLSVTNGVRWNAYEGNYPWVPDFETLTAMTNGFAGRPDVNVRPRNNNVGLLFYGCLKIPRDGSYTFSLAADTGALLRIHDATVIDADYGYTGGSEASGTIQLSEGLHPFRLFYSRRTNGVPSLKLSWRGPGISEEPIPDAVFYHLATQ